MSILRRLIPSFLLRWDLWLQEHWPRLWSTRVHLHLWFLLLANAVALVLGLLIPVDAHGFPDPEEVWGYMMVPAVVYACFWTYRVVLFTVERRFGTRRTYAEVGEFLIHWLSLLLILTLPMTLSVTLAYRIGHLVTDERFNADVNALNELAPWLYGDDTYERDDEDDLVRTVAMAEWEAANAVEEAAARSRVPYRTLQGHGTHEFFRSVGEYQHRHDRLDDVETERSLHEQYEDHVQVYNRVRDPGDTADYDPDTAAYHLHIVDSIEASFPLLRTDHGYFTPYERWKAGAFLTDSVLEVHYVERFTGGGPPDAATITAALATGRFYSPNVRMVDAAQVLAEFKAREASTTSLWSAEDTIDKIAEAKAYGYDFLEPIAILYGMVLSTFCIALLLAIFKNLYWQPFLIAVVTAAVLPILILVFALITEDTVFNVDEEVIMLWCYYLLVLVVLVMVARIPTLKAYRTVPAVMLILANVAVPFFLVFTAFMLDERFDVFGHDALAEQLRMIEETNPLSPRIPLLQFQLEALRQKIQLIMTAALWGGVALYTFALHPVFRWCFTRLMALPERR